MSFEQTWSAADADATSQGDDLDPPADGTYDVTLIEADAFVSKKGDPFVKIAWNEPNLQHAWTVLLGFKTQGQANVTKRQVRDLGVDVDQVGSLDELAGHLKELVGHFFTVTVKTNGQFRNTYIDGPAGERLTDVPADPMAAAAFVPDGDDIPF